MANEFKNSHITKNLILNNSLSLCELSHNNVYIKIHYKRVYHSFPSPEKQLKNSYSSCESLKKKSKITVDLNESDIEEDSINKTYTLFKYKDQCVTSENSTQTYPIPIKMFHNCKTQTEEDVKQKYLTINYDNNTVDKRIENASQTDTIVLVVNQANQTTTKIRQENLNVNKFYKSDIFYAKVTIVAGYNLPLVKLNDDIVPSAPTTYVIMENCGINNLITSSVLQQTNPIWNSVWVVMIPKNKLIEVCNYICYLIIFLICNYYFLFQYYYSNNSTYKISTK